jgi:hypothetical protein
MKAIHRTLLTALALLALALSAGLVPPAAAESAAPDLPDNAYPTGASYGPGWKCSHGYRETKGACREIQVPPNAYLDPIGVDRWKCHRGYRAAGDTCVRVDVPANGFLKDSRYGPGWECDRGYRQRGDECVAISVPANGYPTFSNYGSGWECHRGFRKVDDDHCEPIAVPEHGYLTGAEHRSGWSCERGFREDGDRCVAIRLPDNAHVDYAGNDWDCNKPYLKRSGRCELPAVD